DNYESSVCGSSLLHQKSVQLISKLHSITLMQWWWPATLLTAGAHRIHKVSNIQARTDVFFGKTFAPRTEGMRAFGNHFCGKRNVGRDDQIASDALFHDLVIGNVKAGRHL